MDYYTKASVLKKKKKTLTDIKIEYLTNYSWHGITVEVLLLLNKNGNYKLYFA